MKSFGRCLAGLAVSALLAACGGGGDEPRRFGSLVSFGDSLSDVGSYRVGTVAALGGGKFTVNGPGGKVWTETLAEALALPAPCAARTGLLPNLPGVTGAPVQDVPGCTSYAQGSSRVSSSGTGPNGVALQAGGQQNIGFMADSLRVQFDRHLAKVGGRYSGAELVTVNGGANDLFVQLAAVGSAAGGGAAAAAAGSVAGWSPETLAVVRQGGSAAGAAAASAAVAAMAQAGGDLSGAVRSLVVDKGARHVLVLDLVDVGAATPFGLTLDSSTRSGVGSMVRAFNTQLRDGLAGVTAVVLLDDHARANDAVANPARYGFSDFTTPICGPNAFSSSLVCTPANLIAGDTSRHAFADGVHPTPYWHRKEAEVALAATGAAGWR